MVVNTSALMAYAPVIMVIIWLQTRRSATLKIAKCQNPHTAHQVSVKKTQEQPQKSKQKSKKNKNRKQGLQIPVHSFAKDRVLFLVTVSENALLRKSDLSRP